MPFRSFKGQASRAFACDPVNRHPEDIFRPYICYLMLGSNNLDRFLSMIVADKQLRLEWDDLSLALHRDVYYDTNTLNFVVVSSGAKNWIERKVSSIRVNTESLNLNVAKKLRSINHDIKSKRLFFERVNFLALILDLSKIFLKAFKKLWWEECFLVSS